MRYLKMNQKQWKQKYEGYKKSGGKEPFEEYKKKMQILIKGNKKIDAKVLRKVLGHKKQ